MHVPTRMGRLENNRIDGPKVCTKMCHYISIQWFTTANTGKICILRKTREHLWMTLRFCDSVCGDNGKSSCRVNGELIRRWHLRILVLKYPGQLRAGIFSHNIGHFRQTNSYKKKNWTYDSIMTIMLRNGCLSSIIARRSKKIKWLFFGPPATATMGLCPLFVVRFYINT